MKQSSIIVAALLSCLAVASPDGGACGAQATVTVTQVITSNLGGDSAQGTVTVTLGGNQGPPVAAPSVVTVTQNLGGSAVPSIGGAVDAAIPAISAATSSSIGIAADQSAALPPTVDDSAATTSVDSSSAQTSSSSTSADLDWSFNGSTNNSTTVNSATDDSTTVNSTTDESSADESTTDEFSTDASTTDDPSTDGSTDISQDASSPTTLTKVLTSTINGGPKIITVTSTIKKNVAPTPARLTTITKVFTSVISSANGAVSTVTVTKTEEHTLHPHHMLGTGVKTGSGSCPTHHVAIGKNGKMSFEPSFVKAAKGDTVRFRFFPSNHTVTSSDFDTPCKKNDDFDSGFKPTFVKNSTTFTDYQVKDAGKPLWFHSRQKDECKQGMVFAINPKDQDQFHQFSMKATTFGSNQANSTVNNSNGTTIHTLNLTTSTTVHLTNTTTTNVTQKATPMRLRNRRGFAGRA